MYSLLEECRHYIFGSYVMAFIIKEKIGSEKSVSECLFDGGKGGSKAIWALPVKSETDQFSKGASLTMW